MKKIILLAEQLEGSQTRGRESKEEAQWEDRGEMKDREGLKPGSSGEQEEEWTKMGTAIYFPNKKFRNVSGSIKQGIHRTLSLRQC
jgi:hypothetical protein